LSHQILAFVRALLVASGILFVAAASVQAAEIKILGSLRDGTAMISVTGELQPDDEDKFVEISRGVSSAIVALSSPGGNLVAGLSIGENIHARGFSTIVLSDMECASACALAWLAGKPRAMDRGARIGFHAASMQTESGRVVTSAGNAIVGAYLNRLGIPILAIYHLTQQPPEKMKWLSLAEARELKIDVLALDLNSPSRGNDQPAPTLPSTPRQALTITPDYSPTVTIDLLDLVQTAQIQQRLIRLGFLGGEPDGVWGLRSRSGLRRFKVSAGLVADDILDALTERRLLQVPYGLSDAGRLLPLMSYAEASRFKPRSGMLLHPLNLDDALRIQNRLSELGFYRSRGDGNWGRGSRSALGEFRVVNGLVFSDSWDPTTENALFSNLARTAAGSPFGEWALNQNLCALQTLPRSHSMSVWGGGVQVGDVSCESFGWARDGNNWRGDALCEIAGDKSNRPVTLRFSVNGGVMIDQSSRPHQRFWRCDRRT
jgi:peptidoglycan hydrolase-like protein with peptidoglycan-binding domain